MSNTGEIVTRIDCERSLVSKRWGDAKPVSQSVGSKVKWALSRRLCFVKLSP
jgi:hypothetical protein